MSALARQLAAIIAKLLIVPLALAAITFAFPAAAQQTDDVFPPKEMLDLSGVTNSIEELREQTAGSLRASGMIADEYFLKFWERTVRGLFDSGPMLEAIAEQLEGQFTAGEQAELRAFYTSDFGRRVTAIEEDPELQKAENQDSIASAGRELLNQGSADRNAMLEEIINVAMNDDAMDVMMEGVRALLTGVIVAQHTGDVAIDWDMLSEQLDQIIVQYEAQLRSTLMPRAAYIYRDLSDDDIAAYRDFMVSAAGTKFYTVLSKAMALVEGAESIRLGKALARYSPPTGA